jgi:hypothetical protein
VELQERFQSLRRQGYGLAAISPDPVSILADFATRRGIAFPLLSDKGSNTIRAYRVLNATVAEDNPVFGIPFPGTLVLDRRGIVRARSFEEAYQDRDSIATVLLSLGERAGGKSAALKTPHVVVATELSDEVVTTGTVFSVVFDVTPGRKVHVYAPGAKGYRPIAVSVDPLPGLTVRPIRFPPSEDYHFKPLDEHVPVYQRPFRLVQELVIDASRAGQEVLKGVSTLTIRGRLEYQACDETTCFPPASLPMSWSVTLRPLDRERSSAK